MTINLESTPKLVDLLYETNVADLLTEQEVDQIGAQVVHDFETDLSSALLGRSVLKPV